MGIESGEDPLFAAIDSLLGKTETFRLVPNFDVLHQAEKILLGLVCDLRITCLGTFAVLPKGTTVGFF